MIVGVPQEVKADEYRVALIPVGAEELRKRGHHDPVRVKHGVVHYAVTNMPGAVGRTSTYALCNATLPYLLELADKGYERACADNPAIRAGLNMALGTLTNQAVAEAFALPWQEP